MGLLTKQLIEKSKVERTMNNNGMKTQIKHYY